MYIFVTTKTFDRTFSKYLKKQIPKDKDMIKKKFALFYHNPFSLSLKTHKLSGELSDFYAFSLNYSDRIIFSIDKNMIIFHDVGSHTVYQ